MSRYQRDITQCVMDNKILKMKIEQQEEVILRYMVKITIIEQKIKENQNLIQKIYNVLSNEIGILGETLDNISSPSISISGSNNSDDNNPVTI